MKTQTLDSDIHGRSFLMLMAASITTDPEVVPALVDLALRDGPESVRIVEHVAQQSGEASNG